MKITIIFHIINFVREIFKETKIEKIKLFNKRMAIYSRVARILNSRRIQQNYEIVLWSKKE